MGMWSIRRVVTDYGIPLGIMYSYYHFFTRHFYDLGMCCGRSMEPTLYNDDIIVISKINPHLVEKQDLVIIKCPNDPKKFMCKRVVNLPGEWISNDESFLKIPKGSVWLEGDNSPQSNDSRDYGPMALGLIVGKPIMRIWPSIKYFKGTPNLES